MNNEHTKREDLVTQNMHPIFRKVQNMHPIFRKVRVYSYTVRRSRMALNIQRHFISFNLLIKDMEDRSV